MKKEGLMPIAAVEPMLPSAASFERSPLPDRVLTLERKASRLGGMVNPIVLGVITEHMRVINSYYSNLIEGNSTHPRDIRRAMLGEYSSDPVKRDLQLESIAHIEVQRILENEPASFGDINSAECFKKIHALFYENIPPSLRIVESSSGNSTEVIPGQFRQVGEEVEVGRHLPPEAEVLERFLDRFQEAYKLERLHGHRKVVAAMAAHHRFVWIHPFLDGNGRVARLHTDLFLRSVGLGGYGVWCVSRGLAKANAEYKARLANADQIRQGDLDGRGALSEQRLIEFCDFMMIAAIGQVDYMEALLDLRSMTKRIKAYIDDRNKGLIRGLGRIKPEAARFLERAFMYGEFARADMEEISGLGLSVARKIVQQLKEEGLLTETSTRSPLRWAIPEHAERFYFPDLAPAPTG